MKKLIALSVICSVFMGGEAISAGRGTAVARRPAGNTASTPTAQAPAAKAASSTTSARAATRGKAPVSGAAMKANTSANVNTPAEPVAPAKKISARAATTQKVINTGTKIASATTNTVVDEECKTKYYGCMDSFCMLDNTNGGRCLCSNRNAELDTVLQEIQRLDEQSYAMATDGVDRINMGEDADAVEAMVKKIANSTVGGASNVDTDTTTKKKARSLNLDAWNDVSFDDDEEESLFSESVANDLENKTGDALHAAVADICKKQIPECSSSMSMLKLMYSQQIKSDCTAYENSLKQQRNASAKKLQTAQQALREAALEQHQNANKYDLGQCTIRFKQCMQTTAGCGEDFSNCASMVGTQKAQISTSQSQTRKATSRNSKATSDYVIKGTVSEITIAAATYDTLLAKKPMCESVTKQCVSVKDQVWDTFLREAAPELKSAELIAESNVRMNCIGNISECFQKACKDNIDPNDPNGSYDMCLSRPDTVRSLCKVQIDPCVAAEPKILDYVYARLASMRVDACTKEVKDCLTNDDRCGADYANCIGLDTNTIITKMCPVEKLTACNVDENGKTLKQDEVFEKIETIVNGIMLNIDNNFLTQCQNAANESMTKICGDTESCNSATFDLSSITSFVKVEACKYKDAKGKSKQCYPNADQFESKELFPFELKIDWEDEAKGIIRNVNKTRKSDAGDSYGVYATLRGRPDISIIGLKSETSEGSKEEKLQFNVSAKSVSSDEYDMDSTKQVVTILNTALDRVMNSIEAEPKVQFCMTGRDVQGIGGKMLSDKNASKARFPNLTNDARSVVANALLAQVSKKTAELEAKYTEQLSKMDDDINNKVAEALKTAGQAVEAVIDAKNYENCEASYGQNSAYKSKLNGSVSGGGWCTKKISTDRTFTYNIATYNAADNICVVDTKTFNCSDWRVEFMCTNGCRKYDNGTVDSSQSIQMTKFQ